MSLTNVRSDIRERMNLLGYTEWLDAFNLENVPETIIDKSYHIGSARGDGVKLNMHDQVIDFAQTIVFWRSGFSNPGEGLDLAIEGIQEILCDVLGPARRITPTFKNIRFQDFSLEPGAEDNDNLIKATINLTVQVSLAVT